jgi:hypothetical protein
VPRARTDMQGSTASQRREGEPSGPSAARLPSPAPSIRLVHACGNPRLILMTECDDGRWWAHCWHCGAELASGRRAVALGGGAG